MGETVPKSDLERRYRELAAAWIVEIAERHGLNTHEKIAQALSVDRASVTRYLNGRTRPPIHRLQYVERSLGEKIPAQVLDAFWLSEINPPPAPTTDLAAELTKVLDQALSGKTPTEQRALVEEVREAVRRMGDK